MRRPVLPPRWQKLVMADASIDRRYYELCALSELKNSLRSGDIWHRVAPVQADFEDYLVPPAKFASPSSWPANCRWPWLPIATST